MNELKEITVEEVSFVDAGANPKAKLLLYKRKETEDMAEEFKSVEVDTDKEQLQKRVAELEKALAERDAADKEAIAKAAKEKADADNAALQAVIKRLEEQVKEQVEKSETVELTKIAAKYEILGEKPEELVKSLKLAKTAGNYDTLIGLLDKSLEAVNKAGTFEEIGKKGYGSQSVDAEKLADEYQKADPKLSRRWALDKAYQEIKKMNKE